MSTMINGYIAKVAAINYLSYSLWTLLNKKLFTASSVLAGGAGESGGVAATHQTEALMMKTSVPSPLLCTAFQMFIAGVIAFVVVVLCRVQRSPRVDLLSRRVWTSKILPLGVSRAVDIGCGNVALSLVSVALQQVVKSTLPIFVTILSVTVLRKRVTKQMMWSLVPVVVGTMFASSTEVRYTSIVGVVVAFISCFGRASKAVLNAVLLHHGNDAEKLQPLEIVLLEAPTTAVIILFPGLLLEGKSVFWDGTSVLVQFPGKMLLGNLLCGVLMFITQGAYVTLIDVTSALTCQVLMSIKMLLLVLFSVWWLSTPFMWHNVLGVVLAGMGCVWYAQASSAAQRDDGGKKKVDGESTGGGGDGSMPLMFEAEVVSIASPA